MKLSIHTDGGSRGNPGKSGCGVVVYGDKHDIIFQQSQYLGIKTNNEAEYFGLLNALNWLTSNQANYQIDQVTIYMDSELIVRQMEGSYKVKAPNLKSHFQNASQIVSQLPFPVSFSHVLRHKNQLADQLANSAMDSHEN